MRRTLIWGVLLALVGGWLAFVPLLDVPGFENAFALGLLASFAAMDLGAQAARRQKGVDVLPVWGRAALRNLALLLPPLAIICLNGLFRRRVCDWPGGLAFYALLPGISVLLATTVGVCATVLLACRPRLAALLAWLFVIGSLLLGVLRFYRAPAIFGYDPFAGYFPGTLYDENISLGRAFFWARTYQACWAGAALALCVAKQRRFELGPTLLSLSFAVAAVLLLLRSAGLGFAISAGDVADALGGRRDTPHFIIYYPKGAPFEPLMDEIAREHEFRWAQLEKTLGVAPAGKITSYYFANGEEKRRWMGAESTYIAKPWRHEIYLSHEEFPHGALRHEIAHVFAGEFGDPLFHVSVSYWGWPPFAFNVGMIEGAAVAAEWPGSGRQTPHQAVKAMMELKLLPPLRAVLATDFFRFSATQSYTTAGSFCRFLLDRYGAARFREIYRAGARPRDFDRVYGKGLDALEEEWHAEVLTQPLSDDDLELARDRFRKRGIFERPCPHAVARLRARAEEALKKNDPERAARLAGEVCAEDPGEPQHKLDLGMLLERARRDADAVTVYRTVADDDRLPTPPRARAWLRLVDVLGRKGDLAGARAALERALALPVDETTRRNLVVRRMALGDDPVAPPLRAYFFDRPPVGEPDPLLQLEQAHRAARAAPTLGIGPYLAGRLLAGRGAWGDAARELAEAARLGTGDPLVARETDRLLATAAFLSGDLDTARAAATRLAAPGQPEAVRLLGEDWLSRCRFVATGQP